MSNARDVLADAIMEAGPAKASVTIADECLAALAAAGLAVVPANAVADAVLAERDRCILIASRQCYCPDTKTGIRQQWVKNQIARRILAGTEPPP